MYESRRQQPVPRARFAQRVAMHLGIAVGLVLASLLAGMLGYVCLEGLSALDAFLNAAMLLGGMGPIHTPVTPAGKLFAGLYALYAGLVFIVTAAIVFTPIVHRVLHRLHADSEL